MYIPTNDTLFCTKGTQTVTFTKDSTKIVAKTEGLEENEKAGEDEEIGESQLLYSFHR